MAMSMQNFQMLFIQCLLGLISLLSSFAQETGKPQARHMSIYDFIGIRFSETNIEFETSFSPVEPDLSQEEIRRRAEDMWSLNTYFEWNRAHDYEALQKKPFPYVMCYNGGDGLSGHRRKSALVGAINSTRSQVANMRTLYNAPNYYCGYVQLFWSEAVNIEDEGGITVQPMLSAMKLMQDTVQTMYNVSSKKYYPGLDVGLCPGVLSGDPQNDTTTLDNFSESVTNLLLNHTNTSENDPWIGYTLSSAFYWTSPKSTQLTDYKSSNRAVVYNDVFDTAVKANSVCNTTFSGLLEWTLDRANQSGLGFSALHVEYNISKSTDNNGYCMLALAAALATKPEVCAVEVRAPITQQNADAQWLVQSGIQGERSWFDAGLDGSSQTVAISDTGIDINNCYFRDKNSFFSDQVNNKSRKVIEYIPYADGEDTDRGHGTHVAGTVAGSRSDDGVNKVAGMADGVAKGAMLAFIDIGFIDGTLRLPKNISTLLETGRSADIEPKANIHTVSWGQSGASIYTTLANRFDQYMFENDEFLFVAAVGNDGKDDTQNSVSSPSVAKNGVSVGAHHSYGTDLASTQLGPSYIASFSSRGPTADGRTKPDVVAPGYYLLSAGASPDQPGACDPEVIPGPGESTDGLLSLAGTSMATAVTSGTAALVRQYFEEGWFPSGNKDVNNVAFSPSGALVKAVLLNGAQFMRGVDNGKDGVTEVNPYDNIQNFGRLSLIDSLYIKRKSNIQAYVWDRKTLVDGGKDTYNVIIDKSSGCTSMVFSATLVWVEEGSAAGCVLCVANDLDLTVTRGINSGAETVLYPNGRTTKDSLNNAERVQVFDALSGEIFSINVAAANLAQASQNYSLIATGCFGGAKSGIDASENVFKNDSSNSGRYKPTLVIAIVTFLTFILFASGAFLADRSRKRRAARGGTSRDDEFRGKYGGTDV